jgi:hypothetical protein
MGLLITVLAMISSWIWQLRTWLHGKQKSIADEYSIQVIALLNAAQEAKSQQAWEEIRSQLLSILTAADLDSDRLSEEACHSLRAIRQIGLEVVRDSLAVLHPSRSGASVG